MSRERNNLTIRAIGMVGATLILLSGCSSGGAGGSSSGTSGGNCDDSTTHTVSWHFDGTYTDDMSVAISWANSGGGESNTYFTPSSGATLQTRSLPGCTSTSINTTLLDQNNDDAMTLNNVSLSISVDGTVVDSVTFNGTYNTDNTIVLPSTGGLVVIVGQ